MRLFNLTAIKFKKITLPFTVWMVIGSTFIADTIEFPILGRNISGWAWVFPLIVSIFVIARRPSRISSPVLVWIPWICIVVFYFIDSRFSYPQRNIMLLSPILVGMAVSAGGIREYQLKDFLVIMKWFLYLLFLSVLIRTGMLFTGILPAVTGLAPQSINAALLCSIFAVEYSNNKQRSLFQWIIGATIPVIALMRMAITAAGITIPFTFSSLRFKKRLIFLIIILALGVALFYSERMQTKMFYSGQGNIRDLRFANPNLFTAGRSRLWDLMIEEVKLKPIWGHGANASEEFVLSVTWGTLTHPHNDWLRLLYDYGLIGTSVFVFCFVAQVIHLLRRAKNTFGESRILLYAGASSFLPFVLLMFTDNIILYAAFFGNLQFTIIGLVYAAQKTQEIDARHHYHASLGNGRSDFSYPRNNFSNQRDHYLGS